MAQVPPSAVSEEEQRAARARVAGALGVFALVLVAVLVGLIWAGHQTRSGGGEPASPAAPAAVPGGSGAPEPAPGATAGGWDAAGEAALAGRPMRQFPESASLPQAIAASALPVIAVPAPTRVNPTGVGQGFPATPEGAIGQLAALEIAGLADLNPQTFNAAYTSISTPGAPDPASTPLGAQVAKNYNQLVVQGSDSTPITSRWQLAGAQVKGVTDGGRAAVVCVAGELQAVQESSASVGTGDCQAMRFTGADWRIAPVPAAAPAPITWPGSAAFTQAGYHPTTGGPQ